LASTERDSDESDKGDSIALPWKTRSRQKQGRVTEKEIAKNRGARVHPNSGALRIKHDASDDDTLYEIKDANKTYTLAGKELLELWKRSAQQLKEPLFIVYFTDADLTATIHITKGKQ
jgi:DNA-binding helix-hairpin-helix protein with protein kinase domain